MRPKRQAEQNHSKNAAPVQSVKASTMPDRETPRRSLVARIFTAWEGASLAEQAHIEQALVISLEMISICHCGKLPAPTFHTMAHN